MIPEKIKNPFSKKRYPNKEKFDRWISNIFIQYIDIISDIKERLTSNKYYDNTDKPSDNEIGLLKTKLILINRKMKSWYSIVIGKVGKNIGGKSFALFKKRLKVDSFINVDKPDEVENKPLFFKEFRWMLEKIHLFS